MGRGNFFYRGENDSYMLYIEKPDIDDADDAVMECYIEDIYNTICEFKTKTDKMERMSDYGIRRVAERDIDFRFACNDMVVGLNDNEWCFALVIKIDANEDEPRFKSRYRSWEKDCKDFIMFFVKQFKNRIASYGGAWVHRNVPTDIKRKQVNDYFKLAKAVY